MSEKKDNRVNREIVKEIFGVLSDFSVYGPQHALDLGGRKNERYECVFSLQGEILERIVLQYLNSNEIVEKPPCGHDDAIDGSRFQFERSFECEKIERADPLYAEARFFHEKIERPQIASKIFVCKTQIPAISHICFQLF